MRFTARRVKNAMAPIVHTTPPVARRPATEDAVPRRAPHSGQYQPMYRNPQFMHRYATKPGGGGGETRVWDSWAGGADPGGSDIGFVESQPQARQNRPRNAVPHTRHCIGRSPGPRYLIVRPSGSRPRSGVDRSARRARRKIALAAIPPGAGG